MYVAPRRTDDKGRTREDGGCDQQTAASLESLLAEEAREFAVNGTFGAGVFLERAKLEMSDLFGAANKVAKVIKLCFLLALRSTVH
ncbi:MAG TPA: hypothetical protein VFC44_03685 [Candidatus Saccharimonadales bacterium]|nr:hypothetical protein [Candidatus Saccharimonadales bacterium]